MPTFSISLSLIALCALSLSPLPATERATQSNFASGQLLSIATKEEQIYKRLAEDPEFYNDVDLERQLQTLIESYKAYLTTHPEDVDALILYGKLLRRVQANDAAFNAFLKADELDPNIAVVKQQIGTHLAEQGKGKAALPFYIQAIDLEKNTAIYHFALGQLLAAFKADFVADEVFTVDAIERETLKAFRQAAQLEPENFNFQMRLGEAYYDLNSPNWEAALIHWNKLSKQMDDTLSREIVNLHRARVLGKLGRKKEALVLTGNIQTPGLQVSRKKVMNELLTY